MPRTPGTAPSSASPETLQRVSTRKYAGYLGEKIETEWTRDPTRTPTPAETTAYAEKNHALERISAAPDPEAELESAILAGNITLEESLGLHFYHAGQVSDQVEKERRYAVAIAKLRQVFPDPAVAEVKMGEIIPVGVESQIRLILEESRNAGHPLEYLDAARRLFARTRLRRKDGVKELGELNEKKAKAKGEKRLQILEAAGVPEADRATAVLTAPQQAELDAYLGLSPAEQAGLDAADATVREYEATRAVYFSSIREGRQRETNERRVRVNDVRALITADPARFQRFVDLHENPTVRTAAEQAEYLALLPLFAVTEDEKTRIVAYRTRGMRKTLNKKRVAEKKRVAGITHFTPDLLNEFEKDIIPKEVLDKTVFEEGNKLYDEQTKALEVFAKGPAGWGPRAVNALIKVSESYRTLNWKKKLGCSAGLFGLAVAMGPAGVAIGIPAVWGGAFLLTLTRRIVAGMGATGAIDAGLLKRYTRTKQEDILARSRQEATDVGAQLVEALNSANAGLDALIEEVVGEEVSKERTTRRRLALAGAVALGLLTSEFGGWFLRSAFGAPAGAGGSPGLGGTPEQKGIIAKILENKWNPFRAIPDETPGSSPTPTAGAPIGPNSEGVDYPPHYEGSLSPGDNPESSLPKTPSSTPSPGGPPSSSAPGPSAAPAPGGSPSAPSAPGALPANPGGTPVPGGTPAPGTVQTLSIGQGGSIEGALQKFAGLSGAEAHRTTLRFIREMAEQPNGAKANHFRQSLQAAGRSTDAFDKALGQYRTAVAAINKTPGVEKLPTMPKYFDGVFRKMASVGNVYYDSTTKTMSLADERFTGVKKAVRTAGRVARAAAEPQAAGTPKGVPPVRPSIPVIESSGTPVQPPASVAPAAGSPPGGTMTIESAADSIEPPTAPSTSVAAPDMISVEDSSTSYGSSGASSTGGPGGTPSSPAIPEPSNLEMLPDEYAIKEPASSPAPPSPSAPPPSPAGPGIPPVEFDQRVKDFSTLSLAEKELKMGEISTLAELSPEQALKMKEEYFQYYVHDLNSLGFWPTEYNVIKDVTTEKFLEEMGKFEASGKTIPPDFPKPIGGFNFDRLTLLDGRLKQAMKDLGTDEFIIASLEKMSVENLLKKWLFKE